VFPPLGKDQILVHGGAEEEGHIRLSRHDNIDGETDKKNGGSGKKAVTFLRDSVLRENYQPPDGGEPRPGTPYYFEGKVTGGAPGSEKQALADEQKIINTAQFHTDYLQYL
jgi:hypothetical protein